MKATHLQKNARRAQQKAHEAHAELKLSEHKANAAKEKVRAAKSAVKATKRILKTARKEAKVAKKQLRGLIEAAFQAERVATKMRKMTAKANRPLKGTHPLRTAVKGSRPRALQSKAKAQPKSLPSTRRRSLAAKPAARPASRPPSRDQSMRQPVSKVSLERRAPIAGAIPQRQSNPITAVSTNPPTKPAGAAPDQVLPEPLV